MLLGEDSLFSYFINREIEQLTLGIMGMFYLPLLILIQAYLLIDIYLKLQNGSEILRPLLMSGVLLSLFLVYGFYVYRLRRKKQRILKVEKAVEDLPQIFLNALIQGLKTEREEFLKNRKYDKKS
jgi:hypothetical protein